jgi:hypothetical protein
MNNIRILKTAHNMRNGVHLTDVSEKFIAKALALTCTFYKACDVYELY